MIAAVAYAVIVFAVVALLVGCVVALRLELPGAELAIELVWFFFEVLVAALG